MIEGQWNAVGGPGRGEGEVRKLRRPRVLIVEDDDRVRELIALLMRGEGFDVVELGDGIEALNYLAYTEVYGRGSRRPDLVVADINMPNFSGLDLLQGLRGTRQPPPVMLVTGETDVEIRNEGRRLGAAAVVTKPFDIDFFLEAVEDCMGSRAPIPEPAQ